MPHDTVKISIRRPTASPAVFVAGSFTEPAWEAVELVSEAAGDTEGDREFVFARSFKVEDGDHQYRFRLGDGVGGEEWIVDEGVESGEF
jgi:hypothetical protein